MLLLGELLSLFLQRLASQAQRAWKRRSEWHRSTHGQGRPAPLRARTYLLPLLLDRVAIDAATIGARRWLALGLAGPLVDMSLHYTEARTADCFSHML